MHASHLNQRGFTLVELLVVMTIILMLGGLGVTTFLSAQRSAQLLKSKENLKQIHFHLRQYEQKKGRLPGRRKGDDESYSGSAFLTAVWGTPSLEKSKNNAQIFFCPSLGVPEMTEEDVDDWVIPAEIHYAGLNQEDKAYRKSKTTSRNASKVIIACNKPLVGGEMPHAGDALAVIYLNGAMGEIDREAFGDDWPNEEPLIIGPESPLEALHGLQGSDDDF